MMLVLIDRFSKWIKQVPLRSAIAESFIKAFREGSGWWSISSQKSCAIRAVEVEGSAEGEVEGIHS